jgi:hypothetical protein
MLIRKYIVISLLILTLIVIICVSLFLINNSKELVRIESGLIAFEEISGLKRHFKSDGKSIKIYDGEDYEIFDVKGFELTAFYPGYEQNKSSVSYDRVMTWLSYIADTGANTIEVPYIQPSEFYHALYDYNLGNENPLYVLHGVPIDADIALRYYDAYENALVRNLRSDLAATVDVIHGDALLTDNSRHHSGIYIYDISHYVLGYVLGENTGSEIIILTNEAYPDIKSFDGRFYSINSAGAFDCFVTECMDYIIGYEADKYQTIRLCSYLSSPETDPLEHRNETNISKGAVVNISGIELKNPALSNIFAAYSAHPNTPNFTDYDYTDEPLLNTGAEDTSYAIYIKNLTDFYELPLLITDTGIPSSRGISQIDLDDGYNRGGYNEEEQGEKLTALLRDIDKSGCAGVILNSFADNWALSSTSNTAEYADIDGTAYWQDIESSDEAFGILEFIPLGRDNEIVCTVDGLPDEWTKKKPLFSNDNMSLYADSDSKYLYIAVISADEIDLENDDIIISLDTAPGMGGDMLSLPYRNGAELALPHKADFVFNIVDEKNSYAAVHERSDIFEYRYSYYSYVLDYKYEKPDLHQNNFNNIYLMNRYNILLYDSGEISPPIYYETGRLTFGNADPYSADYNSLADFCVNENLLELRIPWLMINVSDPVNKKRIGDFYSESIDSEEYFFGIDIAANIVKGDGSVYYTSNTSYNLPNMKNIKFTERLKKSAVAVTEYWLNN